MDLPTALLRARKHAGLTQEALAVKSGVKQQVIAKIEKRGQKTTSFVPQLAKACGLTTEEFISGAYIVGAQEISAPGKSTHARVRVPYYEEVKAAAGQGCVPIDEATVALIELSKELLDRCGVSPADAALLQADGDSMSGAIEHGDMMLVDLSKPESAPRQGRIYIVRVNDELFAKRVQRIPNGINLLSENPIYQPITVMNDDQDADVQIVGRVALAWRLFEFFRD